MGVNGRQETQVEMTDDIASALCRAASGNERRIVRPRGRPVAAVIPLRDLELLQRLEEEEEDRIDAEEVLRAAADPANQERIPWAEVKTEIDL